jgi:hypothetical protein
MNRMQPICIVFGDNSKCLIFNQKKTINQQMLHVSVDEFIHMALKEDSLRVILFTCFFHSYATYQECLKSLLHYR